MNGSWASLAVGTPASWPGYPPGRQHITLQYDDHDEYEPRASREVSRLVPQHGEFMSVLTVMAKEGGWAVVNSSGRPLYQHPSKQQVVLASRQLAIANRTALRVLGSDGELVGETTYRPRNRRFFARR